MTYFDYYGLPLPKLDNEVVPLGVCLTMKVMDAQGRVNYHEYKSAEIHAIEALGMIDTFRDTLKQHIVDSSKPVE